MPDKNQDLFNALAAVQAKHAALEEKLRALEQSYTIDKRTVYLVGAALSVLIVAFSGYSLDKMPQKVMERIEANVEKETRKSIMARMHEMDELINTQRASGSTGPASADVTRTVDALAQRLTKLETAPPGDLSIDRITQSLRKRLTLASAGAARPASLPYSPLGYPLPSGHKLDCKDGALTSLTVYTNKDSRFAGIAAECRLPALNPK